MKDEAPHSPREALAVLAISTGLAALLAFVPRGRPGSLLETLHPTLWVLAWTAPAWIALERRRRDPGRLLGLTTRPGYLPVAMLTLVFLPLYAVGFHLVTEQPLQAPQPGPLLWSFTWNLLFVALPEEVFFRGSLQPSIPAPAYVQITATSAAFALVHLATRGPERLIVFFPSLVFGWLRWRTGSVVPGIVFHALCNATDFAVRS